MSDTPETDHALQGVWYRGDHGSAIPDLCRRLERERNSLRNALQELVNQCRTGDDITAWWRAAVERAEDVLANDQAQQPPAKP